MLQNDKPNFEIVCVDSFVDGRLLSDLLFSSCFSCFNLARFISCLIIQSTNCCVIQAEHFSTSLHIPLLESGVANRENDVN